MALVLVAAVMGAGAVVLSIADSEDGLREAQTALAELSNLNASLNAQAATSLDHPEPALADLYLHRQISNSAERAAVEVERLWDGDEVTGIVAPTREVAAAGTALLLDARHGHRRAAEEGLSLLAARSDSLNRQIRGAERTVSGEIDASQREARTLTFAITGAIGLVLSVLVLLLNALRRRQQRIAADRRAARRGERRLQALVRHGSDVIAVLAPDGTVLYDAGAVEGLLGCEPAELEGRRLSEWLHPADAAVLAALCSTAEAGSPARELRLRHRDGSYRTCEARATSLLGDELWNGIVLNIWDVTARKELEQRLRHQAFHDGLTSLANRILFHERLEHALVRGVRAGGAVSVLLIDLDDFKSINDSLGHATGDELLRETARRLDETMRGADTVARLGGDEFGVILDGSESIVDDEEAARRAIAAIAEPFGLRSGSFPVSASVGIARAELGEADAEQLVRDADLAMYAAKASEKGSFAVYRDDMHIASEERLQLKADLLNGLVAGEQLELHYQPVVDLAEGTIVGFEALLRWHHPTRGLINPEVFVPLAEETGAIVPIGHWILCRACTQAGAWIAATGRDLFVSVNVSARQLLDDSLVDHVENALEGSGLAARQLVLEVTETQLIRNLNQALAVLGAIKRLGVRIAIDDFGTGYSSLSQLERLPVDILKVDREFAGDAAIRGEHARLLNAVIEIGHSLELSTIAEGIETPDQLRQLRDLRYPLGQGYLFSKPVPAAAVDALLASSPRARRSAVSG